jgi:hypothetical protein
MVCHIKECTLRILENRVLRKKFGPKRENIAECGGEKCTRVFMICTPCHVLFW